jgi:hypothetical protein
MQVMRITSSKYKFFRSMVFFAAFIVGCTTTNTNITGSWKNPAQTTNYNSILVTALAGHAVDRSTIETELAAAFGSNGVHAISGIDKFPPNFHATDSDKQAFMELVHQTNADAILTISLLKEETQTRYVPGNVRYDPFSGPVYYRTFYGYYRHWYPYVYDPGYYVEDKTYYIETNLYDAKTEDLVWSAQSETYSPITLPDFAKEFAEIMIAKMKEDGMISSKKGTQ